ncbi:bifunctional folylpolyglutamate synthase/dihydrofolate synthase [Hymenobacter properus]|uniref:Dihydrofolate synthase/folylpolyglutamate synthase n=1 Tax=Hymenobacter properus TaxID=2791026 RepID=A0A931BAI1_9BACT|nr:folylpolyglutamate synthase/dihydrofolate synthase family protein [Hymenobacter properus]MBF9140300.1 bifunctional folylpolyglutamate synthase/dihydrofolate synthase [Hymenobacter properus]MBR7719107.1 bifunctional folylpolyglutamate synthase/dihydrofolate synthase [Microvirga sp. SRT04]
MTYSETLAYLYEQLPMFQRVGAAGFKKGLGNTLALAEALGHPERQFRIVHVAGTNGKGSSSHMLAAALQAAGYKVGLYTSPHLREFTERIRVNGQELPPDYLVDWVARWKPLFEQVQPSFFEMCVALAFAYFAEQRVDIAIIEVGLGGRFDSTNIITPLVSLITNISFDHQALLGNTLPEIAGEKAGIIKPGVPVVVSQTQPEVAPVFEREAASKLAHLVFADQIYQATFSGEPVPETGLRHVNVTQHGRPYLPNAELGLPGDYQQHNLPGVLATLDELRALGFRLTEAAVRTGLRQVTQLTGLKGRWSILGQRPLVVCDTGHNAAGLGMVMRQLLRVPHQRLHLVIGTVNDKDVAGMLAMLPPEATYYFCAANIPRALPAPELAQQAAELGLAGQPYASVPAAVAAARAAAAPADVVFIGGSTFVVAEVEELYQ